MGLAPNIYCPKCKSEDIKNEWLTQPVPEVKSIDEIADNAGNPVFTPAINMIHRYKLTCNKCGYFREYST